MANNKRPFMIADSWISDYFTVTNDATICKFCNTEVTTGLLTHLRECEGDVDKSLEILRTEGRKKRVIGRGGYAKWVWQYFKKTSKGNCQCVVCKQSYKIQVGTLSNLKTHMKQKHYFIFKSEEEAYKNVDSRGNRVKQSDDSDSQEEEEERVGKRKRYVKSKWVFRFATKLNDILFKCDLCDKTFRNARQRSSNFKNHLKRMHASFFEQEEKKHHDDLGEEFVIREEKRCAGNVKWVWQYYKKLKGDKCRCLICNQIYRLQTGSLANLKEHIRCRHYSTYESEELALGNTPSRKNRSENNESDESDSQEDEDVPPRRRRRGNAKWVWEYYKKIDDVTCECLICNQTYKLQSDTLTNLKQHLRYMHYSTYESGELAIRKTPSRISKKKIYETEDSDSEKDEDVPVKRYQSHKWVFQFVTKLNDILFKCDLCDQTFRNAKMLGRNFNGHFRRMHPSFFEEEAKKHHNVTGRDYIIKEDKKLRYKDKWHEVYFRRLKDNVNKCKLCDDLYLNTGSTLLDHIENDHKDVFESDLKKLNDASGDEEYVVVVEKEGGIEQYEEEVETSQINDPISALEIDKENEAGINVGLPSLEEITVNDI